MCLKLKLPREISCLYSHKHNEMPINYTHRYSTEAGPNSPGIGTFPRVVESLFLGHGKGFIHLKKIKRLQNYLFWLINYSRKS